MVLSDAEPKIDYGSRLSSIVIQFYISMIEYVEFCEMISYKEMASKSKNLLRKGVVKFARDFVDRNQFMVESFKRIFVDFDAMIFEKIVGNLYLLDVDEHSFEEKLSWCLIHYTTEG